jgi:hypothetical protein
VASLATLAADQVAPLVGTFRRNYPGIRKDMAAPDATSQKSSPVSSGA